MPDDVDELILRMRHLEAAAQAETEARRLEVPAGALRTLAQQKAGAAQAELDAALRDQAAGQELQAKAKEPGRPTLEAAEMLTTGREQERTSRTRITKARAQLQYFLDRMDQAERVEWDALHARARAETHAQLADDPLFKGEPVPPKP